MSPTCAANTFEAFIEDQLARLKPAIAANRYRSLQQFFRWLVDEGELKESPMARMKPPTVPETPPPVIHDDAVKRLLATTEGTGFDDIPDGCSGLPRGHPEG